MADKEGQGILRERSECCASRGHFLGFFFFFSFFSCIVFFPRHSSIVLRRHRPRPSWPHRTWNAQRPASSTRSQGACVDPDKNAEALRNANANANANNARSKPDGKVWVGIAGCPGSGKTTFAQRLVSLLQQRLGPEAATSLPMDGFHLTRAQLGVMQDPILAFQRRGSEWTFDPQRLSSCLSFSPSCLSSN